MRVNKISMDRHKEILGRGFDILTNDPLDNEGNLASTDENNQQQDA